MWAFREWWKTKIDRFWGEEGEHKGTDHNKLDLKFKKKIPPATRNWVSQRKE